MTALHEVAKRNGMKNRLKNCFTAIKSFASVLITIPVVICYICLGAVVFLQFDPPLQWQNRAQLPLRIWSIEEIYSKRIYNATLSGDVAQVEADISGLTQSLINTFTGTDDVFNYVHKYSNDNWTFVPAALQSLCLITAIGSCVNTPPTTASQCFALIYGLLGIPLSCLTIANVGKYLGLLLTKLTDKIAVRWQNYRHPKNPSISVECWDDYQDSINFNDSRVGRISLKSLLCCFLVYLLIGSLSLHEFWRSNIITSTFLCFVSLSTVAIRETLDGYAIILYLLGGLVLTTVALEVAADYLRKLHFSGRPIENCRSVQIHFGGKNLSVGELIWSFGRHMKIEQNSLAEFLGGMDDLVNKTIKDREKGMFNNLKLEPYFRAKKLRIPSSEIAYIDATPTD